MWQFCAFDTTVLQKGFERCLLISVMVSDIFYIQKMYDSTFSLLFYFRSLAFKTTRWRMPPEWYVCTGVFAYICYRVSYKFGPRVYPRGYYVITHVRQSVRPLVRPSLNISETALRIFLIFCLKLVHHKGTKVTEPDFWKKILGGHKWGKTLF